MKKICIFGSTGSIGRQALEIMASSSEKYEVVGLSANGNVALLKEQAAVFKPKFAASPMPLDPQDFPAGTVLLSGEGAVERLAEECDFDAAVMGISGLAALPPLLICLRRDKRVALANKESIVCGRELIESALSSGEGEILPVDSEQSAIFQCLNCGSRKEVEKLWLTASGGPFRNTPAEELHRIRPEDALKHPTWNMGRKITIDSASLFNKGLEIIEASYLFHIPGEQIEVLVHPQSIVHSMVEFTDGTVMANMSCPDMRLPIQYALTYPERCPSDCKKLRLSEMQALEFYAPDRVRFPSIGLAYEALAGGNALPTVYNAANEAGVELFCEGKIPFTDLFTAVRKAMDRFASAKTSDLDSIKALDRAVKAYVCALF